ncbi:MAG: rod-binding protein [Planctomycetes bacterium]|nr:rod-binding protein [Planctomycetota bacterium]
MTGGVALAVPSAPEPSGSDGTDPSARLEAIRAAARAFEGMFLGVLMKEMRGLAGEGGLLSGGSGERTFRGLLDEEYGRAIAGTTGIAEVIEREIARSEGLEAYGREEHRWIGTWNFAGRPAR